MCLNSTKLVPAKLFSVFQGTEIGEGFQRGVCFPMVWNRFQIFGAESMKIESFISETTSITVNQSRHFANDQKAKSMTDNHNSNGLLCRCQAFEMVNAKTNECQSVVVRAV